MVAERRWKMKLSGIFLGLALALGVVLAAPAPVSAAEAECSACSKEYVNGFCPTCGGYQPADQDPVVDGEKYEGYYGIGNAGQLYWFANYATNTNRSANAILTADIVVNSVQNGTVVDAVENANDQTALEALGFRKWTPIVQRLDWTYSGTFDGNEKTISGLYYYGDISAGDSAADAYVGLFGVTGDATIKDLTVADSYLRGSNKVGTFVGMVNGSATIINCHSVDGYIKGAESSASYGTGGIVGYVDAGASRIQDCSNSSQVNGWFAGGICGRNAYQTGCTIERCMNEGTISSNNGAGGITQQFVGSVKYCYNKGRVSATNNAGGIAVYLSYNAEGTMTGCYNTGTVSGNKKEVPIFISYGETVTNCCYLSTDGTHDDSVEGTTALTDAEFKSGKATYLLNGKQPAEYTVDTEDDENFKADSAVWRQTLTDGTSTEYPSFEEGGDIVCYSQEFENQYYNRLGFDFNQIVEKDAEYDGKTHDGFYTNTHDGFGHYEDPDGTEHAFYGGFTRVYKEYGENGEVVKEGEWERGPTEIGSYSVTLSMPEGHLLCEGSETYFFEITTANTKLSLTANPTSCTDISLDTKVQPDVHDGAVTYGCAKENDIDKVTDWQESPDFDNLEANTKYYFFAKIPEKTNEDGTITYCTAAVTTGDGIGQATTKEHEEELRDKTAYYTGDTYCKICKALLNKGHAIIPDQDGDGKPEPDKDGDGIYEGTKDDNNDGEPDNTYIKDQDGDGVPEADDDDDGIYDGTKDEDGDGKPDNTYIPDQDGDGKPEVDHDGDGIYDNAAGDKHYIPDGEGGFELIVLAYSFLDDELTWVKGGAKDMTFTVDAPAEKFSQLVIGGSVVDAEHYTYVSGSTVITLEAEYLNSLNVGRYEMTADYVDGSAVTTLNVIESGQGGGSDTGDDSNRVIGLMLLLQVLCIAAVYMLINKKQVHR